MELLMVHPWPGNIRELRNMLERAAVVAKGSVIEAEDLGLLRAEGSRAEANSSASLREMERRHILSVLRGHEWNITQSAQALGIDRVTLYNKIKKYSLKEEERRASS
jgi:DNA-binding NtrC family response regulator